MERRALWMSLGLHGVILCLMFGNFSFSREYSKPPAVVMHIDLNKVKISDKTNLPQKEISKKAVKNTPKQTEVKKEFKTTQVKPKTVQKESPVPQPKSVPVPKNSVAVQEKKPQPEEKPLPKQIPPSDEEDLDLQSLLATVDKVRQKPVKKEVVEENPVSEGLKGGLEGRLDQLMTISDKDFISSKLRESWNIDGGTDRLDEIVVEVYVGLNKDGSLRLVKYTNHMNLPAFTQVAESAVRAVHIAANKGSESPFKILAEKYGDHYSDWKEMYLRFSPTEGIS